MKEFIFSNIEINLGKFHLDLLNSNLNPILVEGLEKNENGNTIKLKLIFEEVEKIEVLESEINMLLSNHIPADIYIPTDMDNVMLAITELAEKQELDKTEIQLAIAEIAEILGGV